MHAFLLLAALCADPDVEAMKRSLETQISALQRINTPEQKGGDPPSVVTPQDAVSTGSVVDSGPSRSTEPVLRTGQCQCQSRGERACYCLRTGNKCYCPTRGPSTWELTEAGAPIRKVQKQTTPRSTTPVARPTGAGGYTVTSNNGVAYWTDSSGVSWNDVGTGLREGVVYGDRFIYRDGTMHENGSKMAVDIAPKGHWVRRCYGTFCRMEWVPE